MRTWQRTLGMAIIVIVLTTPSSAGVARPAVVVQVSRSAMRQGEVARITVHTPSPVARLNVRFAGRSWPMYPVGPTVWKAILGTDPMTPPGRQVIAVEAVAVATEGARLVARREVTVVRVRFSTRRLTFDPERQALLTPEATARERARVQAALRVLHPEQLWDDPFARPLEGAIATGYGVLSIYQKRVRGFHGGVDIPAPEGTSVRTAGRGIVRLAESLPLSGNAVLIDHGLGVITSYLHLSAIDVHVDQRVKKGDVIGRVGSTGLATGPHLHWGLRVNGVRVDPLPWTTR